MLLHRRVHSQVPMPISPTIFCRTLFILVLLSAGLSLAGAAHGQAQGSARGSFRVMGYGPVENDDLTFVRDYVRAESLLEGWAEELNEWIGLPKNVDLSFRECGEANAFYDSDHSRITMCYELVHELAGIFELPSEEPLTEEEHTEAVRGATDFIFFHEVGHALVDILDLPALGREEDVADALAAYVLIDADDDQTGELAAVQGVAGLLDLRGDRQELTELDFADEHSLTEVRFYNVLCFLYGSDPESYAELVTDGNLPETRAERCEHEYQNLNRNWGRLLTPWLKEP